MTWVLDWNRILNLLVVLTPFFVCVLGGFQWLINRSDKRAADLRARAEKERQEAEEARDERRLQEAEEMRISRQAFYEDIRKEAERSSLNAEKMRELYQNEVERALSLRLALAEAAQREFQLQQTIMDLTRKVDALQDQVTDLRSELARAGTKEAA